MAYDTGDRTDATSALWSVINTHPGREQLAEDNLERQQFRVYCPKVRKLVRHARRTSEVLRPLFPGYLFVHLPVTGWQPAASTYGVRSLLRLGERPAIIDDGFISSLRAREVDGIIADHTRQFKIGQQVQFAGGSFDGLVATIIEMKEKDRLVVLLDLLQRPVRVRIDAKQVVAA
jgi:transcriptional antiterminator RfaH